MAAKLILLVEDNRDDIELTLRAFARSRPRAEVIVARDGVEALDYLLSTGAHRGRDPRARPELILLDLKLPRLDGLDLLKRIRADVRVRDLPVVVLTSSAEEGDREASYRLGANSYVRKPVDFAELAEAAHQIASYWLRLNLPPPAPRGI